MTRTTVTRRRALQALGAAALSGVAGRLLSATRARSDVDTAGPGLADFAVVSGVLTGRPDTDPALALALYHALHKATPDLDAGLATLKATLAEGAGPGGKLAFTEADKAQQALARAILQAWYLGVTGKGRQAACVAYVDTLANRAVAAELVPPSYSYGACGTWQARP